MSEKTPEVELPIGNIPDFGAIDAESDDLVIESFSKHPALSAVLSSRKFLVLGRKGSGKTAIYKMLSNMVDSNLFVVEYTFVDYPWTYHERYKSDDSAAQERYLHSWKYLYLITIAKTLVNKDESANWSPAATEAISNLREFLIDIYGKTDPSLAETFAPSTGQSFLDRVTFDLKLIKISPPTTKPNTAVQLQEFNRNLEHAVLLALNPNNTYFVCFDELDRGFNPEDDNYKQRLMGLLMASRDLNMASTKAGKKFKAIVFLRSDIYSVLSFEDKNKLTETYSTLIEWDTGDGGSTLKSLMERRIGARLGIAPDEAWDRVFDNSSKMRGRQAKYNHIVSMTFRRPRDIIKFCNCILDSYKQRCGLKPGKFTNEDVSNARKEYSKYFRKELEDEAFQYLKDLKAVFEFVRELGVQVVDRRQLEEAFNTWKDQLGKWKTLEPLLQMLFELSVIGYKRVGGVGGGSQFVFKYLDPDAEFNSRSSEFQVHSGLVSALGIKKYSRSSKGEIEDGEEMLSWDPDWSDSSDRTSGT